MNENRRGEGGKNSPQGFSGFPGDLTRVFELDLKVVEVGPGEVPQHNTRRFGETIIDELQSLPDQVLLLLGSLGGCRSGRGGKQPWLRLAVRGVQTKGAGGEDEGDATRQDGMNFLNDITQEEEIVL